MLTRAFTMSVAAYQVPLSWKVASDKSQFQVLLLSKPELSVILELRLQKSKILSTGHLGNLVSLSAAVRAGIFFSLKQLFWGEKALAADR